MFTTRGFAKLHGAHAWLEEILEPAIDIRENYLTPNTILLRHKSNYTLTIKGSKLAKAMNYTPTKAEKEWQIPYKDRIIIERLATFWKPKYRSAPKQIEPPEPKQQPKPNNQRHRTTKAAKDGYITIAEIARANNISAGKARNILRKNNIKKPAQGWTYKTDDPELTKITKLLK